MKAAVSNVLHSVLPYSEVPWLTGRAVKQIKSKNNKIIYMNSDLQDASSNKGNKASYEVHSIQISNKP